MRNLYNDSYLNFVQPFIVYVYDYKISIYRIARNVGGGKHWRIWRIEVRFAKVLCR